MADKKPVPKPGSPGGGGGLIQWKWILIFWFIVIALQVVLGQCGKKSQIPYSQFRDHVAAGDVKDVTVSKQVIYGHYDKEIKGEKAFSAVRVDDPKLLEDLQAKKVKVTGTEEHSSWWMTWLLPIGLALVVFWWIRRRMAGASGGGGFGGLGLGTVGRSKAKLYVETGIKVTFEDVAGVDEAKDELTEVIEFLKTPEKFERLGGKLPKGILLVGPPGTGKTLLARAVAGEAGVPFFSISGSEFVEMFVGVGAARVRDLFTEAKQKAPCIIFIDELDALGKARGVGPMAHEEREQTLNQLLVELDGFDSHIGVVLMAATNRPEILDQALLRAGRFDRHILVDRPDRSGRVAILEVHARNVTLANEDDLDEIAAMTPGMAGADLANILNEAALLAVRADKEAIELSDLREAVERVIAGLEKRNRVLMPDEKARVAHHELGHALVGLMLPGTDRVQKISIIPRGISALGYTIQLPTEERFLMTRSELENKIATLLGGRVAEELIYGEISTGAQDDLRKATDIARSMVEAYGMSEKLGEVSLAREPQESFLDSRLGQQRGDYSEQTAREIDCEVRRIIDEAHDRARAMLARVEPLLRRAAEELIARETLSGDELVAMAAEQHTDLNAA